MLTDKDYQDWAKKLGEKFKVSGRVVRHIRSSHKQKYLGLSFNEFKSAILNDAERSITAIKQSSRFQIFAVINSLSREVQSLDTSAKIIGRVNSYLPEVLGNIDKLGYRLSIINFVRRLTAEQLIEIISDIPDNKADDGIAYESMGVDMANTHRRATVRELTAGGQDLAYAVPEMHPMKSDHLKAKAPYIEPVIPAKEVNHNCDGCCMPSPFKIEIENKKDS